MNRFLAGAAIVLLIGGGMAADMSQAGLSAALVTSAVFLVGILIIRN